MEATLLRLVLAVLAGGALLGLVGLGIWIAVLPPAIATDVEVPPLSEQHAILEALRPTTSGRPVIAVIGLNDATETTDYIMTAGILRRGDVADVILVAGEAGPVQLFPALRVLPDQSVAEFDAAHPAGADYVVVPAMSRDDDPVVLEWLRQQSAKGARIIGVCAGAKVVAAAGLLHGKRATTHWYYLRDLRQRHPSIEYVPDRRMVSDGNVVTTTGISASFPMMLTLIEAIGGRERAEVVAEALGVEHWDARHASEAFTFNQPFATTVLRNTLAFWNREQHAIEIEPGVDEISLGLVADSWARTFRSRSITFAPTAEVVSRGGITFLPDRQAASDNVTTTFPDLKPVEALNATLAAISRRYGEATAYVVAMQMEYLP